MQCIINEVHVVNVYILQFFILYLLATLMFCGRDTIALL